MEYGDNVLSQGDYEFSEAIPLDPPFPYFGVQEDKLYVHTDGILTFDEACQGCFPRPFPTRGIPPIVAVLWQNFDTSRSPHMSNVFYRMTSRDQELYFVYNLILSEYDEVFSPSYVVLVTWDRVPQKFGELRPNTFQAILTTDGTRSYAILLYYSIGRSEDAEVGFNLGDGSKAFSVGSLITRNSSGLETRSNTRNINMPGLYIYRLDG